MSITHKVENRRGRINLVSFRLQIKSAHVELGKMNKELIRNALLGKLANYQNFLNQQFFNKNDTELKLFSQPLIQDHAKTFILQNKELNTILILK